MNGPGPVVQRWARWIVTTILIGGLAVGLTTIAVNWPPPTPIFGFTGFQVPLAVAFGAMGILLLRRQPGNRIGWLLLLEGTMTALQFAIDLPALALAGTTTDALVVWIAWLSNWVWIVSVSLFPPLFLLFPDGRPIGPRWGRVILAVAVGGVLMAVGQATLPGPILNYPAVENPVSIGAGWSAVSFAIGGVLLLSGAALSVLSLVLRWRRSRGDSREQLKWLAFVGIPFLIAAAFVPWVPIAQDLMIGLGVAVPFAIAIAVLRHRLYDIDELIGRTFVYGALTAILAGLYTAALKLFNELFVQLTGAQSESSIILATLVLAAAFTPVRKSLEGVVERRFKPAPKLAPAGSESTVGQMSSSDLELVIRRAIREELAAAPGNPTTIAVRPDPREATPSVGGEGKRHVAGHPGG